MKIVAFEIILITALYTGALAALAGWIAGKLLPADVAGVLQTALFILWAIYNGIRAFIAIIFAWSAS